LKRKKVTNKENHVVKNPMNVLKVMQIVQVDQEVEALNAIIVVFLDTLVVIVQMLMPDHVVIVAINLVTYLQNAKLKSLKQKLQLKYLLF